jgi:FKBP-type peptidyl-prolyl cis-trans isomerase SlyD
MNIEKNKVVSLVYELRSKNSDGEVIESLNDSNPLTFIFGSGSLLPKFEENITGLKQGEPFNFELKCADAYGNVMTEAVVDIPKNVFIVDGELDSNLIQIGNSVPMMDSEGNRLNGVVVSVNDEVVKMDFNHPLAGEDLFFKGKIVDIREATEEEITHGHIHSAHSCGSCGSHEDDGHGGCCGSC